MSRLFFPLGSWANFVFHVGTLLRIDRNIRLRGIIRLTTFEDQISGITSLSFSLLHLCDLRWLNWRWKLFFFHVDLDFFICVVVIKVGTGDINVERGFLSLADWPFEEEVVPVQVLEKRVLLYFGDSSLRSNSFSWINFEQL